VVSKLVYLLCHQYIW